MMRLLQGVREMGFEKPRVAVALLPLSLFSFLYLLSALLGDPAFTLALIGISLCYLTAFIALASEWFWARWFASGLGWSGAMISIAAMSQIGWNPALAILGGLHALIIVMLMGQKMAARYDMQPGWRERFGMDEFGVIRLRKAVTRASAALPSLIVWALGPGQPQPDLLVAGAATLALVGLAGLLRLRTWGLLALAGASGLVLAAPTALPVSHSVLGWPDALGMSLASPGTSGALSLLLAAAVLPFAGAAIRYFRALR
jgi:hypothetical protein